MPRNRKLNLFSRRWLILPPVAIGAGACILLASHRAPPVRRDPIEQARTLRVIRLEPMDVVPRAVGYGTARAARTWHAVAEVPGRVIAVHPDLRAGAMIPEGAELLRIDPAEYELSISQLAGEIEQIQAQLAELDANDANLRLSLRIEQDSLDLAEADLARTRTAFEQRASSQSEIDSRERSTLSQRRTVQELQNSLALLPVQRRTAEASLKVKQAQLEIARLDLPKTVITAPFACRLGAVDLQVGQFLQTNQRLFDASGTDRTEVEAQIRVGAIKPLLSRVDLAQLQKEGLDLDRLRAALNLTAEVRFEVGPLTARWDAEFDRVRESLDPLTRSAGVVVAVDRPYEKVLPGRRPVLVEGAYCEVEIRGAPMPGRLVVPRAAVHEGRVYIVNKSNRLETRTVALDLVQGDIACVESGLEPGDTLVVSDPVPAIEGMLVDPVPDERTLQNVLAGAAGRSAAQ
ncbi:MAG: efflux transporter periplasmic adaptor subunit [Phycisphaerales bacterium]|nr:efflux transporter periplasmic adaptor subunit [Phycisphaerales bacterium]